MKRPLLTEPPQAVCPHCDTPQDILTWGKPRLRPHKLAGSYIACDGSDEEVKGVINPPSVLGHKIPGRRGTSIAERIEKASRTRAEHKLKPELGYSNIPKWYEPDDDVGF